ncbi:MAG TPA: hypothetical protein VF017_19065 [Thermoanaerobaculia bacterium]|nr:hypothetical protein [Thermoanaerobaculia bacterium]
MACDVTARWNIAQTNANGARYAGTLILQQHGSRITGTADWQNHPDGSVVGAIVGLTVSFSVIYAGNLIGHYAAELNPSGNHMGCGVCYSNTGDSGTWEARAA